jgi:hypothetical protein
VIVLAVLLAIAPSTSLSIGPWTGSDFQTTTDGAAKFRLEVSGKPNATLRLRATGVAQGWLAAFCTPHLCSPQQVGVQLSSSGNAVLQFELIRESSAAPTASGATITDGAGASVSVPSAHRQ